MVAQEQLREWKGTYSHIYSVTIDDYTFIYRRVTVAEHRGIANSSSTSCELEDNLIRTAVLYPEKLDLDNVPAMVPTVLAGHILASSMLGPRAQPPGNMQGQPQDVTTIWSDFVKGIRSTITPRKDPTTGQLMVDDPVLPIVIEICGAFPSYEPDKLMDLTMQDLLERKAWAELLLGGNKPEESPPPNIPSDVRQRQKYLEDISAAASDKALRAEMERARGVRARS